MAAEEGFEIKLQGLIEVREAIHDLRDYLPKQLFRGAVQRAARQMAGLIALVAPRLEKPTPQRDVGRLMRNIDVQTRRTATTVRGQVFIREEGGANDPRNAFYWRFLEKGWIRGASFFQHKFIEPAFQQKYRDIAQQVIDEVEAAILRAERRAKNKQGMLASSFDDVAASIQSGQRVIARAERQARRIERSIKRVTRRVTRTTTRAVRRGRRAATRAAKRGKRVAKKTMRGLF